MDKMHFISSRGFEKRKILNQSHNESIISRNIQQDRKKLNSRSKEVSKYL